MKNLEALETLQNLGEKRQREQERLTAEILNKSLENSKTVLNSTVLDELKAIKSDLLKRGNGVAMSTQGFIATMIWIALLGGIIGALSFYLLAPPSDWEVPKEWQIEAKNGDKFLLAPKGEFQTIKDRRAILIKAKGE